MGSSRSVRMVALLLPVACLLAAVTSDPSDREHLSGEAITVYADSEANMIMPGDDVTLTCKHPDGADVTWYKDKYEIDDGLRNEKYEIEMESEESHLTIKNFQSGDVGNYQCTDHNSVDDITLSLADLYMETDKTMMDMNNVLNIWCFVMDNAANIVWQFNSMTSLDYKRRFGVDVQTARNTTGTYLHLKVTFRNQDQAGKYICRAKIKGRDYMKEKRISMENPCKDCRYPRGRCDAGRCSCSVGFRENPLTKTCVRIEPPDPENGEWSDKNDRPSDEGKTAVANHLVAGVVGGSAGTLALVILIVLGFVCYWRKKKKKAKQQSKPEENPDYQYQYDYHGEAFTLKELGSFDNPGYQMAPKKLPVAKDNTYVSMTRQQLEIPRQTIQLGVDLGQGRFGKVIQAKAHNLTGPGIWTTVAVKTCRATATDAEKQDLYKELEIMMKIPKHNNIVALLGCCSGSDPLYIVMEYVQRGSLLSYIRKCRPSSRMSSDSGMTRSASFMQPQAKDLSIFALQVSRGMDHLAKTGIIHRDLATRNVLLGTDFTCKICDFGLARDVEGEDVYERTSKGPLPIRWMAPESLEDNYFTRKSDVWAYGVLLWEIVTLGATPYPGMSAMEVMRQVLNGSKLQRPLHCKEEMYQLMTLCWEMDPAKRPAFADIADHIEMLLDDDYILLNDYEEDDYGYLDYQYPELDERV